MQQLKLLYKRLLQVSKKLFESEQLNSIKKIDKLNEGHYYVIFVDSTTGILKDEFGNTYFGNGDYYRKIFDNYEDCLKYIKEYKKPNEYIDCFIYNHENKAIT